MRSLGEFVGHVRLGLRSDPAATRSVRREVEERHVDQSSGGGRVTLRRTVIEEVEVRPKEART